MEGILRGIDLRDDEGRGIVNTLYRTETSTESPRVTAKATSTENSVSRTMAKESGISDGVVGKEKEKENDQTTHGVQPVVLNTVCPTKGVLFCSPVNDTETASAKELQGAVDDKSMSQVWCVVREQVLFNVYDPLLFQQKLHSSIHKTYH